MKITPQLGWLTTMLLLALVLAACGNSAPSSGGASTGAASPNVVVLSTPAPAVTATSGSVQMEARTTTATAVDIAGATEQSTATEAATTPGQVSGTASDVIMAAKKAQMAANSYRSVLTIAHNGEPATIETGEFVAPDHYHMVVKQNGTKVNEEILLIGATTYIKVNGSQWQQTPMDMNQMIKQFRTDPKLLNTLGESIHDVKLIGSETLDGRPMQVYQYTVTFQNAKSTPTTPSTYKLWIGKDDGLPYKEEGDSTITIAGKSSQTHMSIVVSDYNTDIKIEAPSAFISATAEDVATDESTSGDATITPSSDTLATGITPDATDTPDVGAAPDATDTPDVGTAPDATNAPDATAPMMVTEAATTVADSHVNPLLPFNDCGLVTADDAKTVLGDSPLANPKNGATDMRDVSPGATVVSGFDSFCAWVGGGPRLEKGYRLSYEVYRADKATPSQWSTFWKTLKDQADGGMDFRNVPGVGEDAYYQLGYLYFKQGHYVIYIFILTPDTQNNPDKALTLEKGIAAKILTRIR